MEISKHDLNFLGMCLITSVNFFFGFVRFVNFLGIRFLFRSIPKVVDITVFSSGIDLFFWVVSLLVILLDVLVVLVVFGREKSGYPSWVVWVSLVVLMSLFFVVLDVPFSSFLALSLGFFVGGIFVFYGFGELNRRRRAIFFVAFGLLGILLVIEVLASSTWIWNLVDYDVPFSSAKWMFAFVDVQLSNIFYSLVPWFFMVLLFCWIWIPSLDFFWTKFRFLNGRFRDIVSVSHFEEIFRLSRKKLLISICAFLLLTNFVVFLPYINNRNPRLVGNDSKYYFGQLVSMIDNPYVGLESDRPLTLFLTYSVWSVSGVTAENIVKFMPLLLSSTLFLAVLWFVKIGTKNDFVSLMSAILTTFSFQTTVSVYTYSLANWLGLVLSFLLFILLLKSFESNTVKYVLVTSLVGFMLFLSHPYTWYVVLGVLFAYLFWILIRNRKFKSEARVLFFVVLINGLLYVVYSQLPFGGRAAGSAGGLARSVAGGFEFVDLFSVVGAVENAVFNWVDNLFVSPLLVALAIIGGFSVFYSSNKFWRVLIFWLVIPSLGLFVVGADSYYSYRLLYLIPVQVFASVGVYRLLRFVGSQDLLTKIEKRLFIVVLLLLIGLSMFNYALCAIDAAPFFFL